MQNPLYGQQCNPTRLEWQRDATTAITARATIRASRTC